ncbi:sulfotransferase domain-containing protein [Chromatocurvus halotolerans]|uniref:Sulfotransferase domain-containing protein n=1 Tax=Chromatocurvus halotolerans TaxID=1132028 RepID=A0A4R2KY24_9GAMM|nr:sulfotransferase domain-containing protein [Chromatocurvus halotolerans]TCO76269.1 sulfotransferase domain-containing protein [Chromatocurvus halotolerans]
MANASMADLLVVDNLRAAGRIGLLGMLFWLPAARRKRLERWLRGREEFLRLQRADWVLMSWGKSGRTWLRVMLSRAYTLIGDLPASELLDFDNLRRRDPHLPAVFFTHNNYLRDYTGNFDSKAHFAGKKMVLLVRDPRDVAVSQYFQWQYRMRPVKKFINDYPAHGADIDAWTFVTDPAVGVPRIVDYFNDWARSQDQLDDLLIVRYEDMRSDPGAVLARILAFTGTPATEAQVAEAVAFAAYDNMKKMEQEQFFKGSGARVKPGDQANPASFKVRKAKVGGYREHFDEAQCAELASIVATLDPVFGYADGEDGAGVTPEVESHVGTKAS